MSMQESPMDICDLNENPDPEKWKELVIKSMEFILNKNVQDEAQHNDIQTALDFILSAGERFPEIFVKCYGSSNGNECLAKWIITHLMSVLTVLPKLHIQCKGICKKILMKRHLEMEIKMVDLMSALIQIIKIHNFNHYLEIMEDFLGSLFAMHAALETFLDDLSHKEIHLKQYHFCNKGEFPGGENIIVVLRDSDSCFELLVISLKVLQNELMHAYLFSKPLHELWSLILKLIEIGDCALKNSSLEFLRRLMEFSKPSLEQLFHLIDMMFEMIEGLNNIKDDENVKTLETELCMSLERLVKSKEIFYLHKVAVINGIYKYLIVLFKEDYLRNCNKCMKMTLISSLVECCKLMCSESVGHFHDNISNLVEIGKEHLKYMLSSQEDLFECYRKYFLQVIQMEVEYYFSENHSKHSSQSTILEMRELQSNYKDVSTMSQHLYKTFSDYVQKFNVSLASNDHMNCGNILKDLEWFYETLSLSSGLLIKYINDEERSMFMPSICDKSSTFLYQILDFLSEISHDKEFVGNCFERVTCILTSIAYISDLFDLDFELCTLVIGFASLPWLSSEISRYDLKLKEYKKFFKVSDDISDHIGEKASRNCIYLLCSTSKPHLAHQWRLHALRKAWFESKAHLKCAILEQMVIVRHRISSFGLTYQLEFLEEGINSSDENLPKAVSRTLADLSCSLIGNPNIYRLVVPYAGKEDIKSHIFFTCQECHKLRKEEHAVKTSPIFTPDVSIAQASCILKVVTGLFSSNHASARFEMTGCIKSLYLHIHKFELDGNFLREFFGMGLGLMRDSCYEVRLAFSEVISSLLPKRNRLSTEALITRWINECIDVTGNSSSFVETYLLSLSCLARACDGELFLTCVSIILNIYFFPNEDKLEAMAEKHLNQICFYHNTTMDLLYRKFSRNFCQAVSMCIYETKQVKPNWNINEFLKKVARIFLFDSVQEFVRRNECHLLPMIIMKADSTASAILRCFSHIMDDKSYKVCVMRVIGQIFSHIVIATKSKEEYVMVHSFLEREMESSLQELLNFASHVDSYLLVHLSTHYDQVLQGLRIWIDVKSYYDGEQLSDKQRSKDDLVNKLQPNLLGILVHFDKYLNDMGTSMDEKMKAYESLKHLMELMGEKHITQVRIRVMKTLKIGLQFKDEKFSQLCCKVWSTFVQTVNLSSLGSMLTQIIVFLLPLFNQFPTEIGEIFHFLIVKNGEKLRPHLHDLYFIPISHKLEEVNAVLKGCQESEFVCKGLPVQIGILLKGITHDTLEVRQLALSKLRELLKSSKIDLHNLLYGDEAVDSIISQMIAILLQGCRELDSNAKGLTGQCLGEIGAIDPGRLELLSANKNVKLEQHLSTLDGESFCLSLISEMTKALLKVEDSVQDCVAYAIQQLIKICEVEVGNEKWNQFPDDVREIMTPLVYSRYKVNSYCHWGDLQKPIYGSEKGRTFERWVSTLTGYLGSMMSSEKCKNVFDACYGVVRSDSQVALLLLPAISIQILLENDQEHCDMLLKEILTILFDCQNLRMGFENEEHTSFISMSDIRNMCAQTVFSLLDRINRFLRHQVALSTLTSDANKPKKATFDKHIELMRSFLAKVPQDVLSVASFNCGAYTRSLRHYELYIKSSNAKFPESSEFVDFLLKVYLALDEPDGVSGVMALQQAQPSLTQQIHCFESVGLLSDASTCYDHAIQLDPSNTILRRGLLKIRLAHGELHSVLNMANGMINNDPSTDEKLNSYRVEAAWKLGEWDKLDLYLESENQSVDWNLGLGKLFTAIKSKDLQGFQEIMIPLRLSLMAPLSAASMEMGSYHVGYESIVRLHMLSELEEGASFLFDRCKETKNLPEISSWLKTTVQLWQDRMEFCQPSYKTVSPILDLHRVLLQLIGQETGINVEADVSSCWLKSARIARECGLMQTAHSSLLNAGDPHNPEFCMERAAWFWDKGDFDQAKSCLEKTFNVLTNDKKFKSEEHNKISLSKLLLQLTRYNDETSSLETNSIVKMFKEVRELNPKWEDGYFYTGKYYDKILCSALEQDSIDRRGTFVNLVITNFLQSLVRGSQYIYQSLPRLLSLWLDFATEITERKEKNCEVLGKIHKVIQSCLVKLPVYNFLVVFPQLISRICHSHNEVFEILKDIIVKVLKEYPQQSMWHMIAVSKSSYHMRSRRCQEIFSKAKTNNPELTKFLQDATKMADLLIDLCNKDVKDGNSTLSISQHFKPLLRLLSDKNLSQILMPLQRQMIPTLPSTHADLSKHVAFSSPSVYIAGVEEKVEVLASLQKPKKVTFKGSDGKNYMMLCKPKDDLRKDARLMEFTNIVNRCLKKNQDSRKRDLHIRTFTVTPLDEDCGMLEWVPNTGGLRPILLKLYKEKGLCMSGAELISCKTSSKESLEKKLAIFNEKLLPRHPPIFSEWFLRVFADPTSWYNARRSFGRTTAVMSMVGYILGLGDRHGENILLDSTCGDCVHVDFSCLFNKGESFEYPEVVPFRLTHNMVDAMGVLGYEGIFRKSCEVTLKVMREEMDSLMSVLKTFIFDPLVEWKKPAGGRNNPRETGEIVNEQAKSHVSNIEERLRGLMKQRYICLPLSVEGQVSSLIKEATDEKNLCRMYIGWASYM